MAGLESALYLARGLKMHSGCANDLYTAIDLPPLNSGNDLWLQV